jgi:hypothetical protein
MRVLTANRRYPFDSAENRRESILDEAIARQGVRAAGRAEKRKRGQRAEQTKTEEASGIRPASRDHLALRRVEFQPCVGQGGAQFGKCCFKRRGRASKGDVVKETGPQTERKCEGAPPQHQQIHKCKKYSAQKGRLAAPHSR